MKQICNLLFVLMIAVPVFAEESDYKNLQCFEEMSKPELQRTMSFIRASLGVHCDFCHVVTKETGWQWNNDDKASKITARRMIRMVMEINKSHFDEKPVVSCFTCHQGHIRPNGLPPLPQATPIYPTTVPDKGIVAYPAQQILNKYFQAIGGDSRKPIEKAATWILTGISTANWAKKEEAVEVQFKAPDRWRIRIKGEKEETIQILSGDKGWVQDAAESRAMTPKEITFFRELLFSIQLQPAPATLKEAMVRKTKIGEHESFELEYPLQERTTRHLYFSANTGLLLRSSRATQSPIGIIPDQVDYEDYRDVNGSKIPTVLISNYVDPWMSGTWKFTEIQQDVPIDDSMFRMPDIMKDK